MARICVYCGSSRGIDPVYHAATRELGAALARAKIGIVYGGGKAGLMGVLADSALAEGGEVIGVITHQLVGLEVGHEGLTQLITVDTMHTRKYTMANLADAFIALPGGIGTAEELFEVFTWLKLGLHSKPVCLLNTNHFYDPLLLFLEGMEQAGFIKKVHRELLIVKNDPLSLLNAIFQ